MEEKKKQVIKQRFHWIRLRNTFEYYMQTEMCSAFFARAVNALKTTQNMCYFDTELMWRINMEISKHL